MDDADNDGATSGPAACGPRSTAEARRHLSRHVAGHGIEIGPGHVPFPLALPGVEVRYVDRWRPTENQDLFPELGEEAGFPQPDVVCNLDTDRLSPIADDSQDFVIASHTLEHIANPLWLLDDLHRVLRPGGILVLLLPERHRTFDRDREPTSLVHLIDEYDRRITEVDDDHVEEFLTKVGADIPLETDERLALFDLHRRRSIHVHVWDAEEFFEVLRYSAETMGHGWELVDAVLPDDEGELGCDFGWVLRRATRVDDPSVVRARLDAAWRIWRSQRSMWRAEHDELSGEVEALRRKAADLETQVSRFEAGASTRSILSRALRRRARPPARRP